MPDSNENKPELNESKEPSTEPSPASSPFVPHMPTKEIRATWEMLVAFKEAIRGAQWSGADVQAVAMGLTMVMQMESQYRSQFDLATKRDAEMSKRSREAIAAAGGAVNGA